MVTLFVRRLRGVVMAHVEHLCHWDARPPVRIQLTSRGEVTSPPSAGPRVLRHRPLS
jgi:hypothetical protein